MPSLPSDTVYDLVGLGFGPANIAIAGAITEAWTSNTITGCTNCPVKNVLFLEKHPKFQWHPGMLIPDARMQISFMKDLATLRNPQSPITFLSYLQAQDRLVAFINRGSTIPTRREYADYLSWAAQYVQDQGVAVRFGNEVIAIDEGYDGVICVRTRDVQTGEESTYRTRDIVISPGGAARIPRVLESIYHESPLAIHSSAYVFSVDSLFDSIFLRNPTPRPLRIAVLGCGQSAAEVTLNLRERLSNISPGPSGSSHEIEMIIRKGSLKPSDDSPFANEIFDPSATDSWFSLLSSSTRQMQLKEYKSTNYGVVNPRTIDALYEVIYDQKVSTSISNRTQKPLPSQVPIITISPYTEVISVDPTNSADSESFSVISQNIVTHTLSSQKYDAIIMATGYQRTAWVDMLKSSSLGKYFGLHPDVDSANCYLAPFHEGVEDREASKENGLGVGRGNSVDSSPASESTISTPPTSPFSSHAQLDHAHAGPVKVFITRNYRLVPTSGSCESEEHQLKGRIYLQGVEEGTHGLSDTLLSVLAVRAGELFGDMCERD